MNPILVLIFGVAVLVLLVATLRELMSIHNSIDGIEGELAEISRDIEKSRSAVSGPKRL